MRIRRVAVLIDGGFFIKRLPRLVGSHLCKTPAGVADCARLLCKRHVQRLISEPFASPRSRWLEHVYRLFYYDAAPYDGVAHHPISNAQIQFGKTDEARFRIELFNALRRQRKFALRLGKVTKEDGWRIKDASVTKRLLRTREWLHVIDGVIAHAKTGKPLPSLPPEQLAALLKIADTWRALMPDDVRLGLRQKGVDMRIGLDISTLTLKKQVDTIILVTGDSDFVPAAKLARREGVEFILDPLWQCINDDLHEHVDGVTSGFRRPDDARPGTEGEDDEPITGNEIDPADESLESEPRAS